MFIQEFHGKVRDRALCEQQMDRWREELQPGAKGFVGSTTGITNDGTMVGVACFETEAAARANSDRPEQGRWFEEFSKAFDGDITFHDYTDVDTYREGSSTKAHFVQVMQGHARDMKTMRAMEEQFEDTLGKIRPDLLGTLTGWEPDGSFTSIAYFTTEEEARKNERAMSEDPTFKEYQGQMDDMTFFDLRDPVFA